MAIIPGQNNKNIVIDTPEKQKSRKLLWLLFLLAILTGAVIYIGWGGFGGQAPAAALPTAPVAQETEQSNKFLEALAKVSLNSPIFTDKKFQSLVLSDQLPVVVGEKGRGDPFAPF